MKIRKPLILSATVAALLAGMALPASAAGTTATFQLSAGTLDLSVQTAAPAPLTAGATGTTDIHGSLGLVSVTDNRGGVLAWTVTGTSSPFAGVRGSSSTAVSYTSNTVTEAGTIVVPDGGATLLTTSPASVVAATSVSGNNTASWTPTLNVTMPTGALADTYSGTVTTSVS